MMMMIQTVGRPSANGHTRSQPPLQARGRPVVSQLQGRLQPGLWFVLAAAPPPLTARRTGGEAQLWPSYGQLWPAMASYGG